MNLLFLKVIRLNNFNLFMKYKKFFVLSFFLLIILDVLLTKTHQSILPVLREDNNFMIKNKVYHHELKKDFNSTNSNLEKIFTDKNGLIKLEQSDVDYSNYKNNYVFLGDSFTQGSKVNYDQSFAGILSQKFLNKGINIINLSAVSYSPVIYYKKTEFFINNKGLKFSKMFLFLDVSDPYDELYRYELKDGVVLDRKKEKNYLTKKLDLDFLYNFKKLIYNNTTIIYLSLNTINKFIISKSKKEEKEFKKEYGFIINHQANLWTYDSDYFEQEGKKGISLSKQYLHNLKKILDKQNVELTIIVYPWPGQIYRNEVSSLHVEIWKDWASKNDIKFINLFPIFFEEKERSVNERLKFIDKIYLPSDMHFNVIGHQLVADYLWKRIE